MFKWVRGRGRAVYYKMKLYSFYRWDCYLIKLPALTFIDWHTDPAPSGFVHYRLNILLSGKDGFEGKIIFKWWIFTLFRADKPHCSSILLRNNFYLSFGWIK